MADVEILGKVIDVLKSFPRSYRLTALVLLLVAAGVLLHGGLHWPHNWPLEAAVWLNATASAFVVFALFVLAWYAPLNPVSVSGLPEKKPVFDESLKYFKEGPELKGVRADLLKGMQNQFEVSAAGNPFNLPAEKMRACMASEWEFDRIAFYLFERYESRPSLQDRIKRVKHEHRLLNAGDWQGSLSPLHYAVESVLAGLSANRCQRISDDGVQVLREVLARLDSRASRVRGVFTQRRGEAIITNCERILQENGDTDT